MAKDSDSIQMSEESITLLQEVKKGKPRKFAMICKGTNVVSLIVYKKGNVESKKKEAKEAGKGQFYFGVVDGQGVDIRFVLARSDGFEDAPVKTSVLKEYLDTAADMKCKPRFEIVDVSPEVADEDENAEVPPPPPPPPPQPSETTASNDDTRRQKLEEALSKLTPKIKDAVAAFPDRKAELLTPVATFKNHLQAGELQESQNVLLTLSQLLKSLVIPDGNTQTQQPQPTSNEEVSPLQAEFNQKMSELQPLYEQVMASKAGDTSKMQAFMSAIWDKAEVGDYATAIKVLDRLSEMVQAASGETASPENLGIESGIVAKRKFLLTRFQELPFLIRPKLEELEMEILANDADENPGEIIRGFEAALQTLFDELRKEIDESISAGNSAMLEGLKSRVLSNELVRHLVNNPLMDGSEFQTAIFEALEEIEQQMTA